jgi:hypothetical protein
MIHACTTGYHPTVFWVVRIFPASRQIHEADARIANPGKTPLSVVGAAIPNDDDVEIGI